MLEIVSQSLVEIMSSYDSVKQTLKNGVILHASIGGMSLLMIVLLALFFNGFLRPILILRQVCLIWKAVTTIVEYFDGSKPLYGFIGSCFFTVHQCLSCVFFHQIYKGVCEMVVQKNTIILALKKSCFAFLLPAIVAGIERAWYHTSPLGSSSFDFHWFLVWPLSSGLRLIVTFLIFFYGIKILMSLKANRNFRDSQSQSDKRGQRNFLAISISGMMAFQFLKSSMYVVEVIFSYVNYMKLYSCTREHISDIGSHLECILDFTKRAPYQEMLGMTALCYAIEDISIMTLIFYWKIKNMRNDPQRSNQLHYHTSNETPHRSR